MDKIKIKRKGGVNMDNYTCIYESPEVTWGFSKKSHK